MNTASHDHAAVGGGAGNTASGPASTVSGGWSNLASGESASIGGGDYNVAGAAYATIAGGGPAYPSDPTNTNNRVIDDYGTIGGGGNNKVGNNDSNLQNTPFATVGGGQGNKAGDVNATIGGGNTNTASAAAATVGGGTFNTASGIGATIGGGGSNKASGDRATIGGGHFNTASAAYATIAGGGPSDPNDPSNTNNRVTDDYGAIGGGGNNQAGNDDGDTTNALGATVGGGAINIAGNYATVGGGIENFASGFNATVGGGMFNTASGAYANVGGGQSNIASGSFATVPGGYLNLAQGNFSFAAGRRAIAYNQGCFVLADATDADEPCVNDNRFVFRVTNGFYIWTTVPHTAGGNAWSSVSDRAAKENFVPVDVRDLLERVASIPIQTWNYKSQDASIRHIGPVAQDFYNAFGVGEDDRHISTIDADGVALSAIQGLYSLVQEKDGQIAQLELENLALRNRLNAMEMRMAAVEQGKMARNIDQPLTLMLPCAALLLVGGLSWAAQRKAGQR